MNLDFDRSDWERVRFGDVVRNVNETVNDAGDAGIERVIALEHLDPGELKVRRWGAPADGTSFSKRVRPGQTLFGKRRAYQRKAAHADFEAITSGDILVFEASPSSLLPELLPFFVHSEPFFAHALDTSAGSLSPRTNWGDLAKFEFDLPPLDEQQRIADLLWAVENHGQNAAALLAVAKLTADTAFDEALSAGHSNGWPTAAVAELVTAGPTNGRSATANDQQRGIPTLSISAVRDGRIRGGASVKYVEIDRSAVENFILVDGDFLVVRGNGNKQLTALGGIVRGALPMDCIFPDLLIRLRFDEALIRPDFAARQWNSPGAHGALLRSAKSTNGIWKINGKDIKSHRLVIPPLDAQDALLARDEAMDDARKSAQNALSDITTLKTALINEVFE